jgi:hypothetical protein
MSRIRQWRKTGAAAGLFALVLQLWLSFGHVHVESFAPAQVSAVTALSAPDEHDDDANHHREFCAIYASLHLLASSFVPTAPALTPPDFTASAGIGLPAHDVTPATAPRRFLARAPPLA